MARIYIPTTYDNDFIESIAGNSVNMSVYDYDAADVDTTLYNGGAYYEDIETDGTPNETWVFTHSGSVHAVELIGGLHPPQRPK